MGNNTVVIFIILFLSITSNCYSFYCGKKIVRIGEHKYEVLLDCGKPYIREKIGIDEKYYPNGDYTKYRVIEEWLYIIKKYGHNQVYKLQFNDKGILINIEWLGEQK